MLQKYVHLHTVLHTACADMLHYCDSVVFSNILLPHGRLHVCNTEDYKIHDNNNKSRK